MTILLFGGVAIAVLIVFIVTMAKIDSWGGPLLIIIFMVVLWFGLRDLSNKACGPNSGRRMFTCGQVK